MSKGMSKVTDAFKDAKGRDAVWYRLRGFALWLHTDQKKSWSEVVTELERSYTPMEARLIVNGSGLRGLWGKVLWHLWLMTHTDILVRLFFGSGAWIGLMLVLVGMCVAVSGLLMTLLGPQLWGLVLDVVGAVLFCCGLYIRQKGD